MDEERKISALPLFGFLMLAVLWKKKVNTLQKLVKYSDTEEFLVIFLLRYWGAALIPASKLKQVLEREKKKRKINFIVKSEAEMLDSFSI